MTKTIDNEKTQVCCRYKDSTLIIQMNKGNNYVHVSNVNLLAAPLYMSRFTNNALLGGRVGIRVGIRVRVGTREQ